MKIEKINLDIKYSRNIEGMGEGLVLLKVKVDKKFIGQNFHYFYENNKKPPLDIAINPKKNTIEYLSLFVQDEKLQLKTCTHEIALSEQNLLVFFDKMSDKNFEEVTYKNFNLMLDNKDVYVIDTQCFSEKLFGYKINNNNYIIFDNEDNFKGVVFKNLSNDELEVFYDSKVI